MFNEQSASRLLIRSNPETAGDRYLRKTANPSRKLSLIRFIRIVDRVLSVPRRDQELSGRVRVYTTIQDGAARVGSVWKVAPPGGVHASIASRSDVSLDFPMDPNHASACIEVSILLAWDRSTSLGTSVFALSAEKKLHL